MEQDIFEKLIEQKDFEWVTGRYYDNKNLNIKEGHAEKHLIKQIDEQQKWKKYHNINISQPFNSLVDTYEKISINNIKENKYDKSKRYFDKNNNSLNITDENGLETCLKNSRSKNKLVIVTCFYRSKIRDFIQEYNEAIPITKLATTNFMTLDNILNYNEEVYEDQILIDFKKITEEFYESLKYNRTSEIKEMIEAYKKQVEYNTLLVKEEIEEIITNIENNIKEIKKLANNNIIFEEYGEQEYIEFYKKYKNSFLNNFDEVDIIDEFKKLDEEEKLIIIKEEFVKKLDYYELLDMIVDLMIYYIYIILSKKYNLLKDYQNKIYFIRQLNTSFNSLNDSIYKFERLIRHEPIINNTLYCEDIMFKNYRTDEELLKIK